MKTKKLFPFRSQFICDKVLFERSSPATLRVCWPTSRSWDGSNKYIPTHAQNTRIIELEVELRKLILLTISLKSQASQSVSMLVTIHTITFKSNLSILMLNMVDNNSCQDSFLSQSCVVSVIVIKILYNVTMTVVLFSVLPYLTNHTCFPV